MAMKIKVENEEQAQDVLVHGASLLPSNEDQVDDAVNYSETQTDMSVVQDSMDEGSAPELQSEQIRNVKTELITSDDTESQCFSIMEIEDTNIKNEPIPDQTLKKNQCWVCNKIFRGKSLLGIHMRVHTGEKPFNCTLCDKNFRQKAALKTHLLNHTKIKPFKCDQCDKSFVAQKYLSAHSLTHSCERPFNCEFCDKKFISEKTLKYHKAQHTRGYRFVCDVCEMRFCYKHQLRRHILTHTGEKPFKCKYCSKSFRQKHESIVHMQTHPEIHTDKNNPSLQHVMQLINSLPREGEVCEARELQSFDQLPNPNSIDDMPPVVVEPEPEPEPSLPIHIEHNIEHSDTATIKTEPEPEPEPVVMECIKKFVCKFCGAHFTLQNTLSHHIRQNMCSQKHFTCPVDKCQKVFASEEKLDAHVLTHTNCDICGQSFDNSDDIETHKVEQHNLKVKHPCPYPKCNKGNKMEPNTSQTMTTIEKLLEKPFGTRSYSEKLLIVQNGRPCPKLPNLKSTHKDRNKEYIRSFNQNQYSLYQWLAGCDNKNKLFCWPCLLFSGIPSAWSSSGVDNLNHLTTLQKKHKQSASHLQSVIKLATFGQTRIDALSSQLKNANSQHNLQVKKNHEVLKRLIDVTCFLANQELSFRGHNESDSSLNRGNYIELLNVLKQYDPVLCQHFETATIFKGTSMAIQNDLIKAIADLLHHNISDRIRQSDFVAIMLDETPDIQMKSQLSVVFRYHFNKKIHETFVGFIDVSAGRTAEDLFQIVTALLIKYDIKNKLVAHTYDGASVMSDHLHGLQVKVKTICPNAIFVHCYAHILNLVLSQGLNNIKECRIFFNTLNGIATFASHSSKTTYALKEVLKRKIPSLATTRWSFSSRLVNVVHSYANDIQEYFKSIQDDETNIWDINDRMAASGYCKFLKSLETVFLLNVFSKLFVHSDILFNTLQNPNIDIVFCTSQINKMQEYLEVQRNEGFDEIWQSTLLVASLEKENDQFQSIEIKYKQIFGEIIDNLSMQMKERFASFENLKYFELLNGNELRNYCNKNNFPESLLQNLVESYPDVFEFTALKNELTVFYENAEFLQPKNTSAGITKATTPLDVLLWIEDNRQRLLWSAPSRL